MFTIVPTKRNFEVSLSIANRSFFISLNREQDRHDGMKETKHNGASNVSMESNSRRVHLVARDVPDFSPFCT